MSVLRKARWCLYIPHRLALFPLIWWNRRQRALKDAPDKWYAPDRFLCGHGHFVAATGLLPWERAKKPVPTTDDEGQRFRVDRHFTNKIGLKDGEAIWFTNNLGVAFNLQMLGQDMYPGSGFVIIDRGPSFQENWNYVRKHTPLKAVDE